MATIFWTCLLWAQTPATNPATRPQSIEDEVLANIQHQRIGSRTVADDHLPGAFLARVADRIIRESFEERFRIVISDADADRLMGRPADASRAKPLPATRPIASAPCPAATSPASQRNIRIVRS